MPKAGAAAGPLDARFATQPSAIRTQGIETIKVGQRVLAKNPEVSHFERRTRGPEPNFECWLHLTLEMPKPDGSNLTINMLRSEEWLRNQIGFVVAENSDPSGERLGVSPPCAAQEVGKPKAHNPTGRTPVSSPESARSDSPNTENRTPNTADEALAPLSPLCPILRDILFTSLAAEADGAELLGLTVQMDLPELGLTGEAILTDIQTTPRIEAPLDYRDERQVVTATFHHSSGDVIDLVVADSLGERLGVSPPSNVYESRPAENGQPNKEIGARESEISDFKSPPCDFPKTENLKPKTSGEAETIGTTSNHPFWSVDRQEFVQAGSLEIGERLQTLSGDVKVVQQKLPRPGPQPVFNLEVHDEHVYFVGEDGVLVHNSGTEVYTQRLLPGPTQLELNGKNGRSCQESVAEVLGTRSNTAGASQISSRVTTIPDLPIRTRFGAGDINDVQRLSLTKQLRAQGAIADTLGQPQNLIISTRTQSISGPLRDAIFDRGGRIFQFHEVTRTFSNITRSNFVGKSPKIIRPR